MLRGDPDPFGLGILAEAFGASAKPKAKRRQITHAMKVWIWDNHRHVCNICKKRVSKFSDAEFDHTRAYSKGGASSAANVRITHRLCNRLKGAKSLSEAQRMLGVAKPRRAVGRRKANKTGGGFDLFGFRL